MHATAPGVKMEVASERGFRMMLTHGPSGVTLLTDAPKDNGGEASSFSPTDLLAVSLVTCMTTTMALAASREQTPWGPVRATLEKRMTAAPRKVGEVVVELAMPKELPADKRAHYESVAHGCPVARSLHPDVKVSLTFRYA
jgi:uncharacterized OsmC-like protein